MFVSPKVLKQAGILGMNRRNVDFIARCNDRHRYPMVDNKLKTKRAALDWGIDVPELYAEIRYQYQIRDLEKTLQGLEQFVIKPAQGSGGKGILVIVGREGNRFIKPSGAQISMRELKSHISNTLSGLYSLGGRDDVAMIEELVDFDDMFAHYSYEGVPDIRIIIYRGYPVMAMLRCSTKESDGKANLHQGAVGVGIDILSGKSLFAVQHNAEVTKHPDTGYGFEALAIPHWHKILKLAAGCFDMTGLGYLGADIVLDRNRGPLILEVNARPGLAIQIANQMGLRTQLAKVDAHCATAPNESIDARINSALQFFT